MAHHATIMSFCHEEYLMTLKAACYYVKQASYAKPFYRCICVTHIYTHPRKRA